jgi:DNA-directed RNA polymerase specialized sigma24 family protein
MNPVRNFPSFVICAVNNRLLLFRYARFAIRNEQAAYDIADDTLLALWDKRASLYTYAAVRTFLHTTTCHACHAWLCHQTLSCAQQNITTQSTDFNLKTGQ